MHSRIIISQHFDKHGTRLPADVSSCVQAWTPDPENTFRDYEGALHNPTTEPTLAPAVVESPEPTSDPEDKKEEQQ